MIGQVPTAVWSETATEWSKTQSLGLKKKKKESSLWFSLFLSDLWAKEYNRSNGAGGEGHP